jgi:hypothetical protein
MRNTNSLFINIKECFIKYVWYKNHEIQLFQQSKFYENSGSTSTPPTFL